VLLRSLPFVAAIITSLATQATAEDKSILVASTMSTQDAGLFGSSAICVKGKDIEGGRH